MTREITHMRAFTLALETMGKPPLSVGKIAPTPQLVDQFFNDSTGEGDHGEVDAGGRGMKVNHGNSSNRPLSRTSMAVVLTLPPVFMRKVLRTGRNRFRNSSSISSVTFCMLKNSL
jgi:hypothetical protein